MLIHNCKHFHQQARQGKRALTIPMSVLAATFHFSRKILCIVKFVSSLLHLQLFLRGNISGSSRKMFLRMKIFGVPVFKILRALAARLLFSIHGLIAIWRVASLYQDGIFWLFVLIIIAMFVEGILNVLQRQGAETRW